MPPFNCNLPINNLSIVQIIHFYCFSCVGLAVYYHRDSMYCVNLSSYKWKSPGMCKQSELTPGNDISHSYLSSANVTSLCSYFENWTVSAKRQSNDAKFSKKNFLYHKKKYHVFLSWILVLKVKSKLFPFKLIWFHISSGGDK